MASVAIENEQVFYWFGQYRVQGANHSCFKLGSHGIMFCRCEVYNQGMRCMQGEDCERLST